MTFRQILYATFEKKIILISRVVSRHQLFCRWPLTADGRHHYVCRFSVEYLPKIAYLLLDINFVCCVGFPKLKRELKNIFQNSHNLNFCKSPFFQIFARFWPILHIICDVINFIATILKFFFGHFVYNMTRYYCAKFYIKSIFLSGFMHGGHNVPPPPGFHKTKKARGN